MCFTFTDSLIVERLNSPLPFENFTIEPNSKKAFLYYFISFFLYLSPLFFLCFNFQELHLWTASTQISSFYDTKYKKLFAIPSLPKSIIFYNFVQKYHLVSKIEAYLSTQITKKNLFSSIHSQKCIHLPTILPLLFILARKIRGGEEKRRRKLRESSVPGRNPLSNHERRRDDKLIFIQSVVSTDVEPIPEMGPKSNLVKIISR